MTAHCPTIARFLMGEIWTGETRPALLAAVNTRHLLNVEAGVDRLNDAVGIGRLHFTPVLLSKGFLAQFEPPADAFSGQIFGMSKGLRPIFYRS